MVYSILQIIWVDVLLSGDNALVIALACRNLPNKVLAMALGAGAAIIMRVAFTGIVTELLLIPYIRVVGACLLLYVAVKLVLPQEEDESEGKQAEHLFEAVKIVVMADIVMSLDNVIAVAAAAKGHFGLMVFGLLVSIPIIVLGANIIMSVMKRLPWLVWLGAAFLGYLAGEMASVDLMLEPLLLALPLAGIIFLIGVKYHEQG